MAPCMAPESRSPYTTLHYRITRPGQRDENGSYSPTPRSASCRRTRRQEAARNTQTEPCQSVEAGTAAQILPSQADALGYFAPRQNIQLRWIIIENIPVSVEHGRERASAPNRRAWTIQRPCWRHRDWPRGVLHRQASSAARLPCAGIHCGRFVLNDAKGLALDRARQLGRLSHTDRAPCALTRGVAGLRLAPRLRAQAGDGGHARTTRSPTAFIRMPAAASVPERV